MPWSQLINLLQDHKHYWLLCLALLVANLVFYLMFIAGEIEQIDQLQKRHQTQRKSLTELRQLKLRAAYYAESQKAWQAFLETIGDKITFPDRLNDLETLFQRYNLNPGGLTFKSEKVGGLPLVRFVSSIKTEGNYADLKALLNGIRQFPGLFCIERLAIDKDRKASTLVMKVKLAVYFRDAPRPPRS